ncbi:hypothetical protein KIW84_011526 [Lathyrus oleraceus]|uniref:Uncharacterized protein n=1 Tax=Pisum sativum TaxID=3888 RepID=A0A9D5GV69_PEA|nr:hypothetical protein KIW84_011526 [Pisum sativum]
MDDAGLQKNQIDEIVLVGGSTRIPKEQQLVKDFFEGKEPNKGVNLVEAVDVANSHLVLFIGSSVVGYKVQRSKCSALIPPIDFFSRMEQNSNTNAKCLSCASNSLHGVLFHSGYNIHSGQP